MSLTTTGVWQPGVWASTVWADGVWYESGGAPAVVVKTGTGGIDPKRRRRTIVKPTGLIERPLKRAPSVEERLREAREIQQEVREQLAEQFSEIQPPISKMTQAEIDAEIGIYLRTIQARRELEDEDFIVLLMAVL